MKFYDEILLRNEYAQQLAKRWYSEGLLNDAQLAEIYQTHAAIPSNPNLFIKICLFLFGCICFSFGAGFAALFLGVGFSVVSLVYAGGVLFLLRNIIKERKLHFNGVDNALLYGVVAATLPAIFEVYELLNLDQPWVGGLLFLPVLCWVAYSFGEPVVAVGVLLCGLFVVASLLILHPLGRALLPFALMICAGVVYFVLRPLSRQIRYFYWQWAIEWVQVAALVLLYLAGNYGFVREANAQLNNLPSPAPQITFAPLFWGLTFAVPLVYFYWGVRWRSRVLLLLAMVGLGASVATLYQYTLFLPLEWLLLVGGGVIVCFCIWLIRRLKTPRLGFACIPEAISHERAFLQTIALSQAAQQTQLNTPDFKMGGGDFGGAGAGNDY
ncbi:MAG: hypothetical protein ACK4GN_09750 [Runella sp.]